jgi:hypothetical protein
MLLRSVPIALLVLALGAAGCGNSGDRNEAADVAQRFFAAIESGDGAAACRELSVDTRETFEQDEQKPCREAIVDANIEPDALVSTEVFAVNAKADLANGDSAFLSLTAEGWRLSAVGCKPAGGSPSDVPMDCEIEA